MKTKTNEIAITAINFEDFISHGANENPESANEHNGIAWSFTYKGMPVTHENDNCYIITTPNQGKIIYFKRNEILLTNENGEAQTCSKVEFRTISNFSNDEENPFDFTDVNIPVETSELFQQFTDKNIKCNKELRVSLDKQLQLLKSLPPSRERSLAITNLQQSIMWLGMDLKRLGETAYPDSYNPDNTKIAPTSDGLKM